MSFFYDNTLTSVTIPSTYSTTGAYAVNGDTRLNIGSIRSQVGIALSTGASGTFNYFMCYTKKADGTSPSTNNWQGVFKVTQNGSLYSYGTLTQNWTADYAEYFEHFDQTRLPYGTTVVIVPPETYDLVVENPYTGSQQLGTGSTITPDICGTFRSRGYIRATTGTDNPEDIIGVTRPAVGTRTPGVVGNASWAGWQGEFLADEFGIPIMEEYQELAWYEYGRIVRYPSDQIPPNVRIPSNAITIYYDDEGKRLQRPMINPQYNSNDRNSSRESREEWNLIGLLGQVPILKGQPLNPRWRVICSLSDTVDLVLIR